MKKLTDLNQNFPEWYQDVIAEAELADQSPTRGCMVIRPYGYALWENIQSSMDKKIKSTGAQNAYFPLLIPESFLTKEADHVEGFAPELAVVTHGGGKKLEEPLVVRPTSETIVYYMFERWIKSWRDLPLKINQWANVVRWEMRTRPFLRTAEFLWQEGHTAHYSHEEAVEMSLTMLEHYRDFAENYLAIPVVTGLKTDSEKFPGAERTYTFEALMQDGKALQMGTSHVLNLSFPESFGVKFQDKDGVMRSPYCTSWGSTTRLIGAMIMVHGDQNGLIMPPKLAPIQVVIVPIYKTDEERAAVLGKVAELERALHATDVRVKIDNDTEKTPGAKFYHWEVRGVPIRIEIGPKDLANNHAVVVNRAESDKTKKKAIISLDILTSTVTELLTQIQNQMFERAKKYRDDKWYQADTLEQIAATLDAQPGFYQTGWCGSAECEAKLKEIKATTRCRVTAKHTQCFACKQASAEDVLIAKAY
jgi:prolyl-tRNA synthetase